MGFPKKEDRFFVYQYESKKNPGDKKSTMLLHGCNGSIHVRAPHVYDAKTSDEQFVYLGPCDNKSCTEKKQFVYFVKPPHT